MSPTSEILCAPKRRRIPKSADPYDAYDVPIIYGPSVPHSSQWTMTVLTDPDTGKLITSNIFNGEDNRAVYHEFSRNVWKCLVYDYKPGQPEIPAFVIRICSLKLQELLGTFAKVSHDLKPST